MDAAGQAAAATPASSLKPPQDPMVRLRADTSASLMSIDSTGSDAQDEFGRLKNALKSLLRRDKVRLWDSPHTDPVSGHSTVSPKLIKQYADSLKEDPQIVTSVIESIRTMAIAKREKRKSRQPEGFGGSAATAVVASPPNLATATANNPAKKTGRVRGRTGTSSLFKSLKITKKKEQVAFQNEGFFLAQQVSQEEAAQNNEEGSLYFDEMTAKEQAKFDEDILKQEAEFDNRNPSKTKEKENDTYASSEPSGSRIQTRRASIGIHASYESDDEPTSHSSRAWRRNGDGLLVPDIEGPKSIEGNEILNSDDESAVIASKMHLDAEANRWRSSTVSIGRAAGGGMKRVAQSMKRVAKSMSYKTKPTIIPTQHSDLVASKMLMTAEQRVAIMELVKSGGMSVDQATEYMVAQESALLKKGLKQGSESKVNPLANLIQIMKQCDLDLFPKAEQVLIMKQVRDGTIALDDAVAKAQNALERTKKRPPRPAGAPQRKAPVKPGATHPSTPNRPAPPRRPSSNRPAPLRPPPPSTPTSPVSKSPRPSEESTTPVGDESKVSLEQETSKADTGGEMIASATDDADSVASEQDDEDTEPPTYVPKTDKKDEVSEVAEVADDSADEDDGEPQPPQYAPKADVETVEKSRPMDVVVSTETKENADVAIDIAEAEEKPIPQEDKKKQENDTEEEEEEEEEDVEPPMYVPKKEMVETAGSGSKHEGTPSSAALSAEKKVNPPSSPSVNFEIDEDKEQPEENSETPEPAKQESMSEEERQRRYAELMSGPTDTNEGRSKIFRALNPSMLYKGAGSDTKVLLTTDTMKGRRGLGGTIGTGFGSNQDSNFAEESEDALGDLDDVNAALDDTNSVLNSLRNTSELTYQDISESEEDEDEYDSDESFELEEDDTITRMMEERRLKREAEEAARAAELKRKADEARAIEEARLKTERDAFDEVKKAEREKAQKEKDALFNEAQERLASELTFDFSFA